VVGLATDPATAGPLPVIICGDLNAAPDSPVLRPLHDAFADAWAVGGGDPAAATLRSDHPQAPLEATELLDQRIDHIFVRPGSPDVQLTVESVALLGEPIEGIHPSDHQAVVCDLAWAAVPSISANSQASRPASESTSRPSYGNGPTPPPTGLGLGAGPRLPRPRHRAAPAAPQTP
jgi:hypothetical protein